MSPHYVQGLQYLAAGEKDLAASELEKVAREEPLAFDVQLVLGHLDAFAKHYYHEASTFFNQPEVLARWVSNLKMATIATIGGLVLSMLILILGVATVLTALAYAMYQPYRQAYSQGYRAVEAWTGPHTPIWSYLTHWGAFLFILTFWLAWETRQWLAYTPAASLRKLGSTCASSRTSR